MRRNPLKAAVKEMLLARFSAEVVRKGMARGERWMRAAYGEADYEALRGEQGGVEGMAEWFGLYCAEVAGGESDKTFNKQVFGIYGSGRYGREKE